MNFWFFGSGSKKGDKAPDPDLLCGRINFYVGPVLSATGFPLILWLVSHGFLIGGSVIAVGCILSGSIMLAGNLFAMQGRTRYYTVSMIALAVFASCTVGGLTLIAAGLR